MYCKYKGDCESKRLRSEVKVCELELYCSKEYHCVLEPIVVCKYRTPTKKLSKVSLIKKVIINSIIITMFIINSSLIIIYNSILISIISSLITMFCTFCIIIYISIKNG